jgi:small subunit ribosomal protein S9
MIRKKTPLLNNQFYMLAQRLGVGIGRRKEAVAHVIIFIVAEEKNAEILINNLIPEVYLQFNEGYLNKILLPLKMVKAPYYLRIHILVNGGGISGQADAIRLALVRALYRSEFKEKELIINFGLIIRKKFKYYGFLTRNSRIIESKKYGLKKARRASQYKKR